MTPEDESAERNARPRERRGSAWSFRIGTLLGVPIRVHVTFLFLLFWFGAMSSEAGGSYLHGVVFHYVVDVTRAIAVEGADDRNR